MRLKAVCILMAATTLRALAAEAAPASQPTSAPDPTPDPARAQALYAEAIRWQGGAGEDSPIDLPKADALLRQAAAAGDTEAMDRLGDMSRDGEGGAAVDWAQAKSWYEREAAAGGAWGMFSLAEFYRLGQGVKKDPEIAEQWARKAFAAAKAGEARGELKSIDCLAWCYGQGVGTDRNLDEQRRCLKKGADAGYASSLVGLAWLTESQGNVDDPEVARLMLEAAKKGIPAAAEEIGLWYMEGEAGLDKDPDKGLRWIKRSADEGRTRTMQMLGTLYLRGGLVDKDEKAAVDWFKKGAEKHSPPCMRELAACYEDGVGIEQDYAAAARWYRQAAELEDSDAMLELAKLYELGTGVPADPAEARKWYERASEKGNPDARAWVEGQGK